MKFECSIHAGDLNNDNDKKIQPVADDCMKHIKYCTGLQMTEPCATVSSVSSVKEEVLSVTCIWNAEQQGYIYHLLQLQQRVISNGNE